MTCIGIVTNYHRLYANDLGLKFTIEAYIQTRVLKMTLESLTIASRRSPGACPQLEVGIEKENFKRMDSGLEVSKTACNE